VHAQYQVRTYVDQRPSRVETVHGRGRNTERRAGSATPAFGRIP
jgi:hypothetical protein